MLHLYLIKIGIDQHVAAKDLPGLARTCLLLGLVLVSNFLMFVGFNYTIHGLGQRSRRLICAWICFAKRLSLSNEYFDGTEKSAKLDQCDE